MKQPALIEERRVCVCCGVGARVRHGFMTPVEGEPAIVSITPIVYVSGTSTGKSQTRNAPKIQVCDRCLVLAVGGTSSKPSKEGLSLFAAFRNSLAHRYSVMTGAR
jgi:hypothetical protein